MNTLSVTIQVTQRYVKPKKTRDDFPFVPYILHVNLICAQKKTNREHIEKHGEHIIGKYALRVKVEHHLIGAGDDGLSNEWAI